MAKVARLSRAAESELSRRPDIEKELTETYGVNWVYLQGVSPTRFDLEESVRNQARFEPLDQKTVETYTDAVQRGDAFPAVIAWRPGGGTNRLVIIDGNHRLHAHVAAGYPLDVYEVAAESDPKVIALMTFTFNTKHGRPTSEAERIAQAGYLVENGATIDAAAQAVNLSPRVFRAALKRTQADRRADEVGLKRNEWDSLSASVKTRLITIGTDEGFVEAARLAFQARLGTEEIMDLVQAVNGSGRSAARQREIVAAARERYSERITSTGGGVLATGKAGRFGMTPKARIGVSIGNLLAIPEDDQAILTAYAPAERAAASERLRAAASRLTRLADALDKS